MTTYYYASGQRMAVRRGSTLSLLFGDHLGSTAYTADPLLGRRWTSLRYKTWGEQRYAEGLAPTEFHFTGQRELSVLGLHFYGARWYDSLLGRWIQPDTIVPLESQGVQAWDRYAYANNNPVRYNDPSGHWIETAFDVVSLGFTINDIRNEGFTFWNIVSLVTDVASVILPVVPSGLSHAIRAGKAADKVVDSIDNAADIYKVADNLRDTITATSHADEVLDSSRAVVGTYSRPSNFRRGVREQVWEAAQDSSGMVRDPGTRVLMDNNQPWDMGHKPGFEFRKHQESARSRGISREQFLDEYNDPSHYQPELPSSNRSHRYEDRSDRWAGFD
jgi:RHS repeat-associated protein